MKNAEISRKVSNLFSWGLPVAKSAPVRRRVSGARLIKLHLIKNDNSKSPRAFLFLIAAAKNNTTAEKPDVWENDSAVRTGEVGDENRGDGSNKYFRRRDRYIMLLYGILLSREFYRVRV